MRPVEGRRRAIGKPHVDNFRVFLVRPNTNATYFFEEPNLLHHIVNGNVRNIDFHAAFVEPSNCTAVRLCSWLFLDVYVFSEAVKTCMIRDAQTLPATLGLMHMVRDV